VLTDDVSDAYVSKTLFALYEFANIVGRDPIRQVVWVEDELSTQKGNPDAQKPDYRFWSGGRPVSLYAIRQPRLRVR